MKFLILFLLSFVSSAYAEGSSARMSDGRAYRIDNEGLRVVDQLAELEVRNKELQNRIISLENGLTGVNSNGLPKAKTINTCDCTEEVENLKNQVSQLESISRSSTAENQQLSQTSDFLNQELSSLKIENSELKSKLDAQSNYVRASLPSSVASNIDSNVNSNIRTVNFKAKTLEVSNSKIKNSLSKIQSKIMKRKNILDKLTKSNRGVSIHASSLVTKSGLSLDKLRQAARTGSEGNSFYLKLKEIENILDDDILTASRLKR